MKVFKRCQIKLSCVCSLSLSLFFAYNKSTKTVLLSTHLKNGQTMGHLISSPVGRKKAGPCDSFFQPVKVVISGSLSTCTAWRPAVLCVNCCCFTSVRLLVNYCTMSELSGHCVIASLQRPFLRIKYTSPCDEPVHNPGIFLKKGARNKCWLSLFALPGYSPCGFPT